MQLWQAEYETGGEILSLNLNRSDAIFPHMRVQDARFSAVLRIFLSAVVSRKVAEG